MDLTADGVDGLVKVRHILDNFDTANENITINALKDINLIAGENINLSAGKSIVSSAGDHIEETGIGPPVPTQAIYFHSNKFKRFKRFHCLTPLK